MEMDKEFPKEEACLMKVLLKDVVDLTFRMSAFRKYLWNEVKITTIRIINLIYYLPTLRRPFKYSDRIFLKIVCIRP